MQEQAELTTLVPAGQARAETWLARFDFERDTPEGLQRGRIALEALLREAGLEPEAMPFSCATWRAEIASALFLAAGVAILVWAWGRHRRAAAAAGLCAGLALASLAGGFDHIQPRSTQHSLQVVVEPSGPVGREILLGAHYDSKTEPFDHVERMLLALGVVGFALATGITAVTGAGASRFCAGGTAIGCFLLAFHFAGGLWRGERSHGILDNGMAALLLVETARETARTPPVATRVRFVWWAGEEDGAQGSRAFAASAEPSAPRLVVNLEGVGIGPDLAYAGREWTGRGWAAPAAVLVRAFSRSNVRRLPFPVVTDGGSFLGRGDPTITLLTLPRGTSLVRGLHGSRDVPAAVDRDGVERMRRALVCFLHDVDRERGDLLDQPPSQ